MKEVLSMQSASNRNAVNPKTKNDINICRSDILNILKNYFHKEKFFLSDIFNGDPEYIKQLLSFYRAIHQEKLNRDQLFELAKILIDSDIKNDELLSLINIFGSKRCVAFHYLDRNKLLNICSFNIICQHHENDAMNISQLLLWWGAVLTRRGFSVLLQHPSYICDVHQALKSYFHISKNTQDRYRYLYEKDKKNINIICCYPQYSAGLAQALDIIRSYGTDEDRNQIARYPKYAENIAHFLSWLQDRKILNSFNRAKVYFLVGRLDIDKLCCESDKKSISEKDKADPIISQKIFDSVVSQLMVEHNLFFPDKKKDDVNHHGGKFFDERSNQDKDNDQLSDDMRLVSHSL